VIEVVEEAEGDYQLATSTDAGGVLSFAPPPIQTEDADIDDEINE